MLLVFRELRNIVFFRQPFSIFFRQLQAHPFVKFRSPLNLPFEEVFQNRQTKKKRQVTNKRPPYGKNGMP